MSAVGGIWKFDGEPVLNEEISVLGKGLEIRSSDGGRDVCVGEVGITFREFCTSDNPGKESQPLMSPRGHLIAWDGRLDNGYELYTALQQRMDTRSQLVPVTDSKSAVHETESAEIFHVSPSGVPADVSLVWLGYLLWDTDVIRRLLGDFAVSLWDPEAKRLILARDFAGTRPLVYHMSNKRIIWATEIQALLDFLGTIPNVDENYVAAYLARRTDPKLTPYEGVHAVPPGCMVITTGRQCKVVRFWQPDGGQELHYASDSDYEEHFRDLFFNSVRARLRAKGPVWCELSGGLDSSSVVCTADAICREGTDRLPTVETLSWVFDGSPTADERKYIVHVERARHKNTRCIRDDDYPPLVPWPTTISTSNPTPQIFFAGYLDAQNRLLQDHGSRVLLTGFAGDHLLWSEVGQGPPELADLARQLRLRDLHQATRAWCLQLQGSYLQMFWKAAILYNLPMILRAWFLDIPGWLDPKLVRRTNLRERLLMPYDIHSSLPSRRVHITVIGDAISFVSAGFSRELSRVELRYPFLDRRLVDFCLAVPMGQKIRPGQTRSLHRRAMRGILPQEIANRKDKRSPDESIYRAIAREWLRLKNLFKDSRAVAYGYIDRSIFQKEIEKAVHGIPSYSTVALARAISLEFWLRSIELHRSAGHTVNNFLQCDPAIPKTRAVM